VQAIAAFDVALWDMKAQKAGLSIGKLLGAYRDAVPCHNASGGCLNATEADVVANVDASCARGIGRIMLKMGQPELARDIARVALVRKHHGLVRTDPATLAAAMPATAWTPHAAGAFLAGLQATLRREAFSKPNRRSPMLAA
jgi:hypothetical protein